METGACGGRIAGRDSGSGVGYVNIMYLLTVHVSARTDAQCGNLSGHIRSPSTFSADRKLP